MPDILNKQALINLLIDSPLREPIKINLIDIINNTSEPDLPKVYPTITKELEIFQKATDRRMKLANETITKLGGTPPASDPASPDNAPLPSAPPAPPIPPLNLPPLPQPPALHIESDSSREMTPGAQQPGSPPLSVPPLDLPPLPTAPLPPTPPPLPAMAPLGATPAGNPQADEAALAEIQKELDSLKSSATADAATPPVKQ